MIDRQPLPYTDRPHWQNWWACWISAEEGAAISPIQRDVARAADGRSYLVGLVYSSRDPAAYLHNIVMGAMDELRTAGYGLTVHPCDISEEVDREQILLAATRRSFDGLIILPPCDRRDGFLDDLSVPFVLISPRAASQHLPHVRVEDEEGAFAMTSYLLKLGHRRIGFIKGNREHQTSHDRFAGYQLALEAFGVRLDLDLIRQGDYTFESGLRCARQLLALAEPPTAVFASNDEMAQGVLQVAHEMGLAVPGQLSVAGFDDEPTASRAWPPLTSVKQPVEEMSARAASLLLAQINRAVPDAPWIRLPTQLVLRASAGPHNLLLSWPQ